MRTRHPAPTAPAPGHSLPGSLARLDAGQGATELRFGDQETAAAEHTRGWHRCSDMLSGQAGFEHWHDTLGKWLSEEFGEAPDRTVGGYVKAWYLQVPAFLGAMLFHHERRVPSLRPQDVSFRIATRGRPHPDAIALTRPGFACLPDDPAAAAAEATVVASEAALANLLRARVVAHAAQFIAMYRPPAHFGRHAMWAAVTDALDVSLLKAGKLAGDEAAGVADAALVLPARIDPFTSASTAHTVCDDNGEVGWTRRKESCCFKYLLTEGAGACKTCPRRSPPLASKRRAQH